MNGEELYEVLHNDQRDVVGCQEQSTLHVVAEHLPSTLFSVSAAFSEAKIQKYELQAKLKSSPIPEKRIRSQLDACAKTGRKKHC